MTTSDCTWKGHVLVEVWSVHSWVHRPLLPHTWATVLLLCENCLIFQPNFGIRNARHLQGAARRSSLQEQRDAPPHATFGLYPGVAKMAFQHEN